MTHSREIKPLTSLRLFAAMIVLFHHYYYPQADHPTLLQAILIEGHIGVTIFFTLSGFLIALRYFDDFHKPVSKRVTIFRFISKRIARIYPLYFTVLVIALVTMRVPVQPASAYADFSLTQSFFVGHKFEIVPTAWSLSIEEHYYLLMIPILFMLVLVYRRTQPNSAGYWLSSLLVLAGWVIGLAGLGVLLHNWALTWSANPNQFMSDGDHIVRYTIFGRFFDFAVGIVLALLYRMGWLNRLVERAGVSLVVCIVAVGGIFWAQYQMHLNGGWDVPAGWQYNYFIPIFTAALIAALINPQHIVARLLSLRLPVYLGRVSYGLYLIQSTFIVMPVVEMALPYASQPLLYLLIIYGGMNVTAAILYEIVEKPAQSAVLRVSRRLEAYLAPRAKQANAAPVELSSGESSV